MKCRAGAPLPYRPRYLDKPGSTWRRRSSAPITRDPASGKVPVRKTLPGLGLLAPLHRRADADNGLDHHRGRDLPGSVSHLLGSLPRAGTFNARNGAV